MEEARLVILLGTGNGPSLYDISFGTLNENVKFKDRANEGRLGAISCPRPILKIL